MIKQQQQQQQNITVILYLLPQHKLSSSCLAAVADTIQLLLSTSLAVDTIQSVLTSVAFVTTQKLKSLSIAVAVNTAKTTNCYGQNYITKYVAANTTYQQFLAQ